MKMESNLGSTNSQWAINILWGLTSVYLHVSLSFKFIVLKSNYDTSRVTVRVFTYTSASFLIFTARIFLNQLLIVFFFSVKYSSSVHELSLKMFFLL